MPLQKVVFKPGVNRENTRYTNEGGWYESDKVRFRQGTPEKIGGWQRISGSTYNGVCRSLWNWVTLGFLNLLGVGTNTKFYISNGGTYYDITPLRVTTTLGANPFAMSYMVGIGRRHSTKKPLFVHEDGRDVLWGIATGIMCGGGADCGGTTAKNTLRGGLSEIGGYDAACEETWMNSTAWFLAVLALLAHDDFETLKVQR